MTILNHDQYRKRSTSHADRALETGLWWGEPHETRIRIWMASLQEEDLLFPAPQVSTVAYCGA